MHVDNNQDQDQRSKHNKDIWNKAEKEAKSNRTKIETTKEKIRNSGHNF